MSEELSSLVVSLHAARHFEQAALTTLHTLLLIAEKGLEASHFARQGRLLGGVVHLRPADALMWAWARSSLIRSPPAASPRLAIHPPSPWCGCPPKPSSDWSRAPGPATCGNSTTSSAVPTRWPWCSRGEPVRSWSYASPTSSRPAPTLRRGEQGSLVEAMCQAARAFVMEARRRQAPLDIDLAESLRGFVLAEAVQQVRQEEAFRLLGRESLATDFTDIPGDCRDMATSKDNPERGVKLSEIERVFHPNSICWFALHLKS